MTRRRISPAEIRVRSSSFVIEDRGARASSPANPSSARDRILNSGAGWADFDRELRDRIGRGSLAIDPKTNEVVRVGSVR